MSVALVGTKRVNKRLSELLSRDPEVNKLYLCRFRYEEVKHLSDKVSVVDEEMLYKLTPEVVVEDVGAVNAKEVILKALSAGSNVVVVSASVFTDKVFLEMVEEKAAEVERYVVVPFGALPAMDALEALSLDTLIGVDVWVRRAPEQLSFILKEAGLEPDSVEVPVVVYEGSAVKELEKVKEDINTLMAAVLASRRDPNVKIIADKDVGGSEYKILMKSEIAEIEVKTKYEVEESGLSTIMIYSVYRAVKRLLKRSGVVVL